MVTTEDAPIRPAATVAVLRDGPSGLEVLMVKRAAHLAFYGGAWVFPGGRIDPEDGDVANGLLDAARAAAVRELREEAGLVARREDLVCFARWLTPPGRSRRFDTFYFAVRAPETPVELDPREAEDFRWLSPAAALAARASGQLELPPPTFVTLQLLLGPGGADDACARLGASMTEYIPRPCPTDGGFVYLYEGDAGYATSDPVVSGARHRLWALGGDWRYERSALERP